jgi:hypothetical protein
VSAFLFRVKGCPVITNYELFYIFSLYNPRIWDIFRYGKFWLEVLTAVTVKMAVLWVVAPCRLDVFTDGSEVCTASIIRAMRQGDGGSTDLRNVGKLTPVYTALQPRRQPSSGQILFNPCSISKSSYLLFWTLIRVISSRNKFAGATLTYHRFIQWQRSCHSSVSFSSPRKGGGCIDAPTLSSRVVILVCRMEVWVLEAVQESGNPLWRQHGQQRVETVHNQQEVYVHPCNQVQILN